MNRVVKDAIDKNYRMGLELDDTQEELPVFKGTREYKPESILSALKTVKQSLDNKQISMLEYTAIIISLSSDEPFRYKVKNIDILKELVLNVIKVAGDNCDLNWIDVSQVKSFDNLFVESTFNGDISKWQTNSLKRMCKTFYNSAFKGDISNWNVSQVTTMEYAFSYAQFNGDLSKWNVSNVKNFQNMFDGNEAFNNNSICNWKLTSATNISAMFRGCPFNLDLSHWDVSNVLCAYDLFSRSGFDNDSIKAWKFPDEYDGGRISKPHEILANSKLESKYDVKITFVPK